MLSSGQQCSLLDVGGQVMLLGGGARKRNGGNQGTGWGGLRRVSQGKGAAVVGNVGLILLWPSEVPWGLFLRITLFRTQAEALVPQLPFALMEGGTWDCQHRILPVCGRAWRRGECLVGGGKQDSEPRKCLQLLQRCYQHCIADNEDGLWGSVITSCSLQESSCQIMSKYTGNSCHLNRRDCITTRFSIW